MQGIKSSRNILLIIYIVVSLCLYGVSVATSTPSPSQGGDSRIPKLKDDELLQGSVLLINNQTLDLTVRPVLFVDEANLHLLSLVDFSDAAKCPYIVIKENSRIRPQGITYYLGGEKWAYPSYISCVDNQLHGYMYSEAKTYLYQTRYLKPIVKVEFSNVLSNASNTNAMLAARQLTGSIIKPDQEFSFYSCVKTSPEQGYKAGTVLVETEDGNTETDEQFGGGICKTATLLHKAVVLSGFLETERHSHTGRVSYADLGDDAAVSKNDWDYKFVNTRDLPIKIVAYQERDNLVVEIYMVPEK